MTSNDLCVRFGQNINVAGLIETIDPRDPVTGGACAWQLPKNRLLPASIPKPHRKDGWQRPFGRKDAPIPVYYPTDTLVSVNTFV